METYDGRILEPYVMKHLERALKLFFELKDHQSCSYLHDFIANFIRRLCEKLDVEVLQKTTEKVDGKSFEDWLSWYVDEATQVQAHAIETFAFRLIDLDGTAQISLKAKIPCDTGYRYISEFPDCWRSTVVKRRKEKAIPPSSDRAQRRRQSQSSAPYLSDVFFYPFSSGSGQ